MHPNLAPHLHTPECNAIVERLQKCRAEHQLGRYFAGACNEIDRELLRCLKWERNVYRIINGLPKAEREKALVEERKKAPSFTKDESS